MYLADLRRPVRQRRLIGHVLRSLIAITAIVIVASALRSAAFSNLVRAVDVAAAAMQPAADNPVVVENQQAGTNGWWWSRPADDTAGQIKGYASASSVRQNETLTFYVTVNPAQTYTIDIYRLGWYAGLGGRHRLRVGPLDGVQQPPCPTDATTGLIACNWPAGHTLTVPADWTSGVYAALLTNAAGFQNYVIFVVRDDRPAAFLYQQNAATDQAYNNYPNNGQTGKSLHAYNSYGANTVSGNTAAVKVSFDRPMADSGIGPSLINWEINLLRWLERSGYDVTYATDVDTHANGARLRNHRGFLIAGHSEYWSKEMFDAMEAARDAGVNLAFFGGNAGGTQIRLEPSAGGVANRVVVCYRSTPWNPIDPLHGGPTTTSDFRSSWLNRPEQTLVGVQWTAQLPNIDYVVSNSSHWAYAGTGLRDGDVVPGIVGMRADSLMAEYPPPTSSNQTLLSRSPSPFTNSQGQTIFLNSSIYQAPSGAWVFGAGTLSWSWALDDVPGPISRGRVDPRIQQTTANILNAFAPAGPPPTITSFTPASGAIGTSVTINGTEFTGATSVRFNGIAATFTVTSSTAIQATVPTGATTGPLSVTTPRGTAISTTGFTIVIPPPTITSFTPTTGSVGSIVTINGTTLTGATAVAFNGTAATFAVTSDTAIRATVPSGATTGPVTVTTPAGTATSTSAFTVSAATANPIVLENQQTGSNGWWWSTPGNDVAKQIKGYASATSVKQNESLTFYVTVNPAQTYTIDIYRIGWYGGQGGRHRLRVGPLSGVQQPPCDTDSTTGLIACNWAAAHTLTVPADWTSGVYAALLTNAEGFQNYVIFVVRDDRPAAFLYQQSVATDQAYNNYPNDNQTGKSLYHFNSFGANTVSGGPGAVKVSFDRPYADSGTGLFMQWEINLVRWLERSGYDVTYSTDVDTHANGARLRDHRAFLISAGHDEYWSKEMFDAMEAARDAGVNLAFFGGNNGGTQIRFEPSAAGLANRVVVCYRTAPWNPIDPLHGTPTMTSDYRSWWLNRPEQTLIGVQTLATGVNAPYVVINSSHWVYAGTGFRDGDAVPGIVGYEADAFMPEYPAPNSANYTLLSRSPFTHFNGTTIHLNSSIYQAPSGAWVFAAGTMSWSWALDDLPMLSHGRVDARIQRTTENILNAFLNGPPVAITSFTPTNGPVGTSVTINGTEFTGATAVRFNGTDATFTVTSATAIQTTVPAAATTGPLSVITPRGTATSATNFTVGSAAAPTITSFTPTSGPSGTSVTITGTELTGATAVRFNGTDAPFTVTAATSIQATVPAAATTGPLSVVTPAGTATSATNFTVVQSTTPTIAGFTPTSGIVGTSVTINGTELAGATAVTFNGTAASFTVSSATAIQATVPAGATTGPLSVVTPGGTATSATSFTVVQAPTITSFTPTSGPVGTSVTINGTELTGATAVRFNGTAATFTVTSATAIQAVVPGGATTGLLTVTTAAGTATSATNFTVLQPPAITSFTPTNGPVGTSVTITGTEFTGVTAVRFNGTGASFTVSSATAIQAVVPAGATTGLVTVTTAGGTATSATSFTVVQPPVITSFTPTTGPVGTSVAISGSELSGATAVRFNGTAASFTVTSATAIQATVPAGATTGPLSVTTPGGTATSATNFTVLQPPTITSFAPASAPVGTSVTINGTTLSGATAVTFNGTAASFTVTSATAIQATVPASATTGPIRVTTAGGTATSATSFAVVPTITSFTPASGPVGTSVTISGTTLSGATAVTFNGTAASFTVTSATAIQATVPAAATTGPIRVTTAGGTATSATSFTVLPAITSFTPTSGLEGSTVTISGTTFGGATAVRFNGTAATFTVISSTTIQATVPTGATSGPLAVTTPSGTATSSTPFTVMFTLRVSKTGLLASGTVTSSPAGINCGSTCSAAYSSGTVVTLTATPGFLSLFTGWSGCDSVSGNTCTVTMSRARNVTANFLP